MFHSAFCQFLHDLWIYNTEGHSWSSQQLSWMWNYDYLIRMNKRYAILPMLHIAKVKFTAIAIAQDPDVARSQGIPLDNSTTSSDDWFFTRLKSYDIMTWYCSDCSQSSHQYWRARFITRKLSSNPLLCTIHVHIDGIAHSWENLP